MPLPGASARTLRPGCFCKNRNDAAGMLHLAAAAGFCWMLRSIRGGLDVAVIFEQRRPEDGLACCRIPCRRDYGGAAAQWVYISCRCLAGTMGPGEKWWRGETMLINTWAIRGLLLGITGNAWAGDGGNSASLLCTNDARFQHDTNPLPSVLIFYSYSPLPPLLPPAQPGWLERRRPQALNCRYMEYK